MTAWGAALAVVLGLTYGSENERPAATPSGTAPAAKGDRPAKTAAEDYPTVLIRGVPFVRQKPDFCGEACAAMWLQKLGRPVDQNWVFDQSGLDPREARGCYTKELAAAIGKIGFRVGPTWYRINAERAGQETGRLWKDLYSDLAAGVPSIVCMHYDQQVHSSEHFRLVLGYLAPSDEVVYHEPAEAQGSYRRMKRTAFLSLWPLKYGDRQWTVVRMRLEPGRLIEGRTAETFTAADYAQHMMQLKRKVPAGGFTVVIQPPFVVIGDGPPEEVRSRAKGTVQWAVDKLKVAYFEKDPAEILDIWLFRGKESYEKHVPEIFHSKPDTPFGYYSDADRALVMNIDTGGGTLVHEIVHPFVAANFPHCPAWFNEGLGSLYEQSGEVDGRIHGYTNWRLAGIQKAIRKHRVPAFQDFCATSDRAFYEEDRGTNYGQARYLCYYLQQHDLLRKFYRQFLKNRQQDPTGYATLCDVLGRKDLKAFQKEWEAWVLELKFPDRD
jgi:hypothetical protein